jgi:hypothetical protein
MKRALLVALAALATAAPAAAFSIVPAPPNFPSGSSIGEGVPLKAYATVSPTVQFFGGPVTATLAIVADTKWVDPVRLQVTSSFVPYKPVAPPMVTRLQVGRFAQITWTWTLRCLTSPCVPRIPPSDRVHVFNFHQAHITYLKPDGKPDYGLATNWPQLEVYSQLSVATVDEVLGSGKLRWIFHLTPVASPTYARSPTLLFWLALGLGLALFGLAAFFGWRLYLELRPRAVAAPAAQAGTSLERALAVLAYAHERGDETLQRKAFERVADELGLDAAQPEIDELTRTARELAWSQRTPADDEVEGFAEQARGTGKRDEEVGV